MVLLGFVPAMIVFGPMLYMVIAQSISNGSSCAGMGMGLFVMGGFVLGGILNVLYLFLCLGAAIDESKQAEGIYWYIAKAGIGCSLLLLPVQGYIIWGGG